MVSISGREVSDDIIKRIVKDIKSKKELSGLEDTFVSEMVINHLSSDAKTMDFIVKHEPTSLSRSQKYKSFLKEIRERLRQLYGVFQKGRESDKIDFIMAIKKAISEGRTLEELKETHKNVLSLHLSSKERLPFYESIYSKIFNEIKEPKAILDLGCGFNPFSIPWMNLKKCDYYASELNSSDVKFINEYFDQIRPFGINGQAFTIDLRKIDGNPDLLNIFPKVDVCFMFKLFDSVKVATKNKFIDKVLMEHVKASFLVVSFATKTIGAHEMNVTNREWLEKICVEKLWPFNKFEVENELFYIIKK